MNMLQLIAKIDKSSRARLSWIQSFGASFGIVPRPIYGHIPLAQFPEEELQTRIEQYGKLLEGHKAIPVFYTQIAVILQEAAVVAKAKPSEELSSLRDGGAAAPWQPDTTLIRDDMVNLNWIKMAMDEMFQPFEARVERIEIVRAVGDRFEVIAGFDLET